MTVDLSHSDVWGHSPITSISGSCYFVMFVDDYSSYSWVFLMRSRDELLNIYLNFANMDPKQLKFFVLTMHVNIPNMHLNIFYIPI